MYKKRLVVEPILQGCGTDSTSTKELNSWSLIFMGLSQHGNSWIWRPMIISFWSAEPSKHCSSLANWGRCENYSNVLQSNESSWDHFQLSLSNGDRVSS